MSIASEITRLQQAKTAIGEAIVAKGGEVSGTLDTYASAIEALPSGGSVSVLEGDITITNDSQFYFRVTHNLGKRAIYASADYVGEVELTYRPYHVGLDSLSGICVVLNSVKSPTASDTTSIIGASSNYRPHNEPNYVQFFAGNSGNYKFIAGTYHYKIYYAI